MREHVGGQGTGVSFLGEMWATVTSALALNPQTLLRSDFRQDPWAVAVCIGVLSGLSTFLGQIVVMAVNQIRGLRLLFSSVAAVVGAIIQYAVQGVVLWALGLLLIDKDPTLSVLVQAMLVSTAPRMLNFLIVIPYSGPFFGAVTSVWSLLALWALVGGTFQIGGGEAFALALASGLALNLTAWALSKPLGWLRDRVWRAVTGRPMRLTAHDIQGRYPLDEQEWRRILYGPTGTVLEHRRTDQ